MMGKPTQATSYRADLPPPNPVEVSEDEEDLDPLAELGAASGDPVSAAVVQMSKILSSMRKEKARAKDKSLEGILDFAEPGSASASLTTSTRSRAAAVRSLQRMVSSGRSSSTRRSRGSCNWIGNELGQRVGDGSIVVQLFFYVADRSALSWVFLRCLKELGL